MMIKYVGVVVVRFAVGTFDHCIMVTVSGKAMETSVE